MIASRLFYEESVRLFVITRSSDNVFAENSGTLMWAVGKIAAHKSRLLRGRGAGIRLGISSTLCRHWIWYSEVRDRMNEKLATVR